MGQFLFDNFSILHLSVGVIFYYFGFSLLNSTIIHIIFELLENTKFIMNITNNTKIWPGGKPSADTYLNMIGDSISFIFGWIIARIVDKSYEPDAQIRGKYI